MLSIWTWLKFYHLVNSFPNKPWFLHVYSASLLKTLLEKEKLLVSSNISFANIVFYPLKTLCHFHLNLKLLSTNSFSLEESNFIVWESVRRDDDHKHFTWLTKTDSHHVVKKTLTLSQTTNFRLFQTQSACRQQFQT